MSTIALVLFPGVALAQRVTKVTSGDEVVIEGVGKVRLLGVKSADQPAMQLGGQTPSPPSPTDVPRTPAAVGGGISLKRERPSRTFLQQIALGKTVRLQYDSLVGGKDRAYLFLEDGTLLNAEVLRTGHARVDLSKPFGHQEEFKRLEDEARKKELGIWIRPAR